MIVISHNTVLTLLYIIIFLNGMTKLIEKTYL